MKAPDNVWFEAFQPSGEFLKVEKNCFFSFIFNSYIMFCVEAGMIMSVTAFFFFTPFNLFFDQQVTKE